MNEGLDVLVLECDPSGKINRVIEVPAEIHLPDEKGMTFARLAATGSITKALSLISNIGQKGVEEDWEVNLKVVDGIKTYHFWGLKADECIWIVGSEIGWMSKVKIQALLQEGAIPPAQVGQISGLSEEPEKLLDEISKLNNELVTMQRVLAKKNAELALLNQEKNHFLGMAAHDLRNPLSVIYTTSEILRLDINLLPEEERDELITNIHTTSEFMFHLVEDLLDVSIIESGELKLDYTIVNLTDLIKKNALLNRPIAARKQIALDYHLHDIDQVVIDEAKISQVLNNLIGNAIKFSEPGQRIEISLDSDGENFRIAVKDHGIGMTPEQINHLFTPFAKGSPGTKGEKSTGLGLNIVKRIVEGHRGKLWVESAPGEGSAFFVSIPLEFHRS